MAFKEIRIALLQQKIEEIIGPPPIAAQRERAWHHIVTTGHNAVKFNEHAAICHDCGELPDG